MARESSEFFTVRDPEFVLITILIIATTLFLSAIYLVNPFAYPMDVFNDLSLIVLALAAALAVAYTALSAYGWKTLSGKIWFYIALGCLLWALGDIGWAVYELILGIETPYPSFADVIWLLAYPFFWFALVKEYRLLEAAPSKSASIIFLAIFGALCWYIWSFVIGPMAEYPIGPDFTFEQKFVSILYPSLDLVLIFFTGLIFIKFRRGARISPAWFFLLLAFLVSALADTWFMYLTWNFLYTSSHPVNLLYHASYLLFIIAAYYLRYAKLRKWLLVL